MATVHFSDRELSCFCCGQAGLTLDFLNALEELRRKFGKPMPVTSGYRCESYDAQVGGAGPHTIGAVDVAMHGPLAHELISAAMELGWTGIGVKQHGQYRRRFLHFDRLAGDDSHPRPRVWTYA